ncbi:sigma-70 family RNA polymerase sigma factor [Chitinophaga sp. Mgbs1]|uniref:Sigma-70 family RNA polymerase sigma factor n=1 Tax=Chitinophaga solisilvae TaxID=1233460 RepID=A0A433WGV8_9BACT|nr:sigma-70 family RNA polymerase sigma factor [Chitinophaga solisilvae]
MSKEAFLSVIAQHQHLLHKICRLYRDTLQDREDLFQEIIYQLWKSYPDYQGLAKPGTWMYRIALNTALMGLRRKKPRITYTDQLPEQAAATEPSTEQQELLFKALRQLSDAEKAIITLYLEDLSYQEIAAITGVTENYIGVKINRIKTKIKTILNL